MIYLHLWTKSIFFVCVAGYLAVSLFLNESHELLLLLVNTVLKVGASMFPLFVVLKKLC